MVKAGEKRMLLVDKVAILMEQTFRGERLYSISQLPAQFAPIKRFEMKEEFANRLLKLASSVSAAEDRLASFDVGTDDIHSHVIELQNSAQASRLELDLLCHALFDHLLEEPKGSSGCQRRGASLNMVEEEQ
jgi:hypothetical protein